jgi:hypothetical protein
MRARVAKSMPDFARIGHLDVPSTRFVVQEAYDTLFKGTVVQHVQSLPIAVPYGIVASHITQNDIILFIIIHSSVHCFIHCARDTLQGSTHVNSPFVKAPF